MHARLRNILLIAFVIVLAACSSQASSNKNPPSNDAASPTPVVVQILDLNAALIALPTATPEPVLPTPTPVIISSPTPLPTQSASLTTAGTTPAAPACTNQAEFVRNLTISDNTALEAGQTFAKIWKIKNIGTCPWTSDYTLRFFSGDAMNGPAMLNLPNPVQPGETVDVRLDLVAPTNMASYTGNWVLADSQGNLFGIGQAGDEALTVAIRVKPTPRPTPGCVQCDRGDP